MPKNSKADGVFIVKIKMKAVIVEQSKELHGEIIVGWVLNGQKAVPTSDGNKLTNLVR